MLVVALYPTVFARKFPSASVAIANTGIVDGALMLLTG
jgi:hypothetical protein